MWYTLYLKNSVPDQGKAIQDVNRSINNTGL